MSLQRLRRFVPVLLAALLLVGAGSATALAAENADQSADDVVELIDERFVIEDATLTVSDTTVTGPGLPDEHVEERTYTVEQATAEIDGLTLDVGGTTYKVCDVTIVVDDVGVTLENVTLSDGQ